MVRSALKGQAAPVSRRRAASAAARVRPDTARPVIRSNRMTVPSSVRMQLMPELGAGAGGGAAPAVPVNRGAGGSTGSGASAPECARTGEEDSPDDGN